MKTNKTNSITFLSRWMHFLGMMLVVALMVPDAAVAQSSPPPVDLGTAGNFVILAKTGISTTGTTEIVGDLGISPAAASFITGFDLIMDPSGTFSTSSLVTGKIYAADYAEPTPTMLTTAVGDMITAYNDAAGRPNPDYTELYGGDITGQTLTRGLYKWTTGVLVSAGGVTISGTASDVWIFQIAQGLTLANGAVITLQGGAKASNIFWQVAGSATFGTTSDFKGIVLCQTNIVMQTGASFDGRALAQTAVTLDANNVIPVELTSFSALVTGNDVKLLWETASELNNSGFSIERKYSNSEYLEVGFVPGFGTTTEPKSYSFVDSKLEGGSYTYRLKQIDFDGSFTYSNEIEVEVAAPATFSLDQNYPNPFNPSTTISFTIPKSFVTLKVFDVLGNEVATLANEEKPAGTYQVSFDASLLSSGVYLYKIQAGDIVQTRKMLLLK
jgi:hypothetical protein